MSSGHFDRLFDRAGGRAFRIVKTPLDGHQIGYGTGVLTKADLERPSCSACYRPLADRLHTYCLTCRDTGAAHRHEANRRAGW